MKKLPDLSIIILNYNTKKFLVDCLKSIARVEKNNYSWETIVVDNASTDGSVEAVQNRYSDITILRNKKNLGFAAGNNKGVSVAKGRYILFLNPDTVVMPETLKEMIKFMDDQPKAGIATCRVELLNGKLDEACHRGFPTPWNAFCHFSSLEKMFPKNKIFSGYLLGYLPFNKTHQIDAGVGAFLLVRRQAGEEANWWDEDYFWYGEDLDFCYRIKEKGWQIFFVPKVKILHYKGVSSGIRKESQNISLATRETKTRSVKSSIEVMRIFYRKHYLKEYPKIVGWLVMRGIDILEKIRLLKSK